GPLAERKGPRGDGEGNHGRGKAGGVDGKRQAPIFDEAGDSQRQLKPVPGSPTPLRQFGPQRSFLAHRLVQRIAARQRSPMRRERAYLLTEIIAVSALPSIYLIR